MAHRGAVQMKLKSNKSVEAMYEEAASIVRTFGSEVHLADYVESVRGQEFLSCPVRNADRLDNVLEKGEEIRRRWPGSDVAFERNQSNGKFQLMLHLPLYEQVVVTGKRTSASITDDSGAPSTTWPMFLTMVDTILLAVLGYRLSVFGLV